MTPLLLLQAASAGAPAGRQAAAAANAAANAGAGEVGGDSNVVSRPYSCQSLLSSRRCRLHRRHEQHRQAQQAGPSSNVGADAQQAEHTLMLAGALLHASDQQQAGPPGQQQQQPPDRERGSAQGSSSSSGNGGDGDGSSTSGSSTDGAPNMATASAEGIPGPAEQQGPLESRGSQSQGDGSVCPVCLDLPADICIAPCRHRACLGCCGQLAAYCASSSGGAFGLPATGPLCPLCRAPIESFLRAPG